MMNLPAISYNFGAGTPVEKIPERLEQLASAGAVRVMLDASQLVKTAKDPLYRKTLADGLERSNLKLMDVHAPHGACESFGFPSDKVDQYFLDSAVFAMNAAADLGAETITLHCARTRRTGENAKDFGVFEKADLPRAKEKILRQLEILLPHAEKLGLRIALENLFLPSSTAAFIVSLLKEISHPLLGLNYDSGHALLLEYQPGKKSDDIAGWIRCGWDDDTVVFQENQLELMLEYIFTAHLHDNHGCEDEHALPGNGIADWKKMIQLFSRAPRLISLQSEVSQKFYGETPEIQIGAFRSCGF